MHFSCDTLDDLLREVLSALIAGGNHAEASRGKFVEIVGCSLELTNPRARLSRSEGKGKIFSALGELLWYLSGDTLLDFIDYYVPGRFADESDDGVRVRSGYGDRLSAWRGVDQLKNVVELLRNRPSSRRAVIQLFDATDLNSDYRSIPCTCTLQFLARDLKLHLLVSMRSNDAYIGLPHDVFAFTMIQEIVARATGLELGRYLHWAGSMHLYEKQRHAAQDYLDEGWQASIPMPEMPIGDPWPSLGVVRAVEQQIRKTGHVDINSLDVEAYWKDVVRLLDVYAASQAGDAARLTVLDAGMSSRVYKMFIQARIDRLLQ